MRWWPWSWRSRKASRTQAAILLSSVGTGLWTPRNYEQLAREGYAGNPVVYQCVRLIAHAVGGLVWLLQQQTDDGRWLELTTHPLLTLLSRPNPRQAGPQLLEELLSSLLISGNAYLESVGPEGSGTRPQPPRELYVLRADRVTIQPGSAATPIAGYQYRVGGTTVLLPAEQVLHLRLYHPVDDWYGLSPLQVLARAVDADTAATTWQASLLQRGARPSGALVTQQPLTEAQVARLRAQLETELSGPSRAGLPLVLEGGLSWVEMGLSPRELDWLESRRLTKLEIAAGYGVPPELLGLREATFENRREARKAFYSETILPLADYLTAELNAWLVPRFGPRLRLLYDPDAIPALQEDRDRVWRRVSQAPWLTLNEQRLATGYDELPGGDVVLVPLSVTPLTTVTHDTTSEALDESEPAIKAGGPRDRRWRWHARTLAPIERAYTVALRRWLARQRGRVEARLAAMLGTKGVVELLLDLDEETEELVTLSGPALRRAVRAGGETARLELRLSGTFQPSHLVESLITTRLRQLRGIVEQIRRELERTIQEGLASHLAPPQLAAALRDTYAALSESRAQTIARTETARAYNATRHLVMEEQGVREIEWLSANDERVRTDPYNHAIDGERRRLGERFSNGLRFPGDPEGAAGNVINCRCVTVPVLAETEPMLRPLTDTREAP